MHFCTSGALPSALTVIQTMLLKSVNLSMMKSITEVQSWTEEKTKQKKTEYAQRSPSEHWFPSL